MNHSIAAACVAVVAPSAMAQIMIDSLFVDLAGGGQGTIDTADFSNNGVFFANTDTSANMPDLTTTNDGRTVAFHDAGTGTSGGIIGDGAVGRAGGFTNVDVNTPSGLGRNTLDDDTIVINAMASVSASFNANSLGEFEGGFVGISGFANGTISFDTAERLIATVTGDFLNVPGLQPTMILDPGSHFFFYSIGAPLQLSGSQVTNGVDITVTESFSGQITLTRIPTPGTALVFVGTAALLRRRR